MLDSAEPGWRAKKGTGRENYIVRFLKCDFFFYSSQTTYIILSAESIHAHGEGEERFCGQSKGGPRSATGPVPTCQCREWQSHMIGWHLNLWTVRKT